METKIYINDLLWTIETVEPNSEYLKSDDGDDAYGITDKERLYIYLQNDKLEEQLYIRYIIHELTHAFLFSHGLDWEHLNEEQVAYFVQSNIFNILKSAKFIAKTLFNIEDFNRYLD